MSLKSFNSLIELKKINNRQKKYLLLVSIAILFVVTLSLFLYTSYAKFKISHDYEIVNTSVGNFEIFELVQDFAYATGTRSYTIEESGYYQMEAWGSKGASGQNYAGGNGGYISGYKYFEAGEVIYITMGYGGAGGTNDTYDNGRWGGTGGGATDFRFGGTAIANRILTAGGGGGGGGGSVGQPGGSSAYTNGVLGSGSAGTYKGCYGGGGAGGGGGGYYGGAQRGGFTDSCCCRGNGGGGGSSHATLDVLRVYTENGIHTTNGKARLTYIGKSLNNIGIETERVWYYEAAIRSYAVHLTGYYLFEVWGSKGGAGQNNEGGNGGYAAGYAALEENDLIYIAMGYGGASGTNDTLDNGRWGGHGGGATDFRFGGNALSNRVIIAGGGGGGGGGSVGKIGGPTTYINNTLGSGTAGTYKGCYGGGGAGGGGGGYYGGNELGGFTDSCCCRGNGSGGGSSFATDIMENVVYEHGINTGSGKAKITYVGTTLP